MRWTSSRAFFSPRCESRKVGYKPVRAIGDERIVLNVGGAHVLRYSLVGPLLVDHHVAPGKDVVLVADSTRIVGIDNFNHHRLW